MMIDTNIYLLRYPFRRVTYDDTSRLVTKLRRMKVTSAWASSFEGILHRDMAGVNERLAVECQRYPEMLIPFGMVSPMLPDWEEDVRRCAEVHKMPGIRLLPNYHGYKLDDAKVDQLFELAEKAKLIVQIPLKLEDERTQHPLVQTTAVDAKPLVALLRKYPEVKVVLLNSQRTLRRGALTEMAKAGHVYFDIAMQEGVGGIEKLLKYVPLERLLFGSFFPNFIWESAFLKLQETELGKHRREAITSGNANQILKQS